MNVRAALTVIAAVAAIAGPHPARSGEYTPRTNYILRCTGCHGMDGAGSPIGGIPDFRNLIGAFAGDDDGRTYVLHVPGVAGSGLSARETAAVLNFVMANWAGTSLPPGAPQFTEAEVVERRQRPVVDVVQFRRTIVARLTGRGIETAGYPWP